jgi:hypothetical protein
VNTFGGLNDDRLYVWQFYDRLYVWQFYDLHHRLYEQYVQYVQRHRLHL